MMIINDMNALRQAGTSSQEATPYVDWAPEHKTTSTQGMLRRGADPDGKSPEPRVLLLGTGFIIPPVVAYSCYSRKNTLNVTTNDLYQGKDFVENIHLLSVLNLMHQMKHRLMNLLDNLILSLDYCQVLKYVLIMELI